MKIIEPFAQYMNKDKKFKKKPLIVEKKVSGKLFHASPKGVKRMDALNKLANNRLDLLFLRLAEGKKPKQKKRNSRVLDCVSRLDWLIFNSFSQLSSIKQRALICLLFFFVSCTQAQMFTGVVESSQTQVVNMPQVRGWQGKISEMVEEGTFVEIGDFLVRIDGSEVDSTIEGKIEQLDVFRASAKRDMIQIEIDLNNAQLAFEKAKVDRKVAKLKADVPVNFIGELEYKERQLALKTASKELQEAENKLKTTQQKKKEKQLEVELGLEQKQKDLAYWQGQLESLTINAKQSGYVIYAAHPWTGSKYQVGDQANSGMEIMKVSKKKNMKVTAWVNAIDIPKITEGKAVKVSFDALPNIQLNGEISSISSGGRDKKDWGDGLYYEIEVSIPNADDVPLLPGMSALIDLAEV